MFRDKSKDTYNTIKIIIHSHYMNYMRQRISQYCLYALLIVLNTEFSLGSRAGGAHVHRESVRSTEIVQLR